MSDLRNEFESKGFVVLKGIINENLCNQYISSLTKVGETKKNDTWTIPDGVVQNEFFWSIIFNHEVLREVRNVLGSEIKFLQHNDLHYGYSSFAWHRDSINRTYSEKLPDWSEENEKYSIVRCGFYFQPLENNFELGVVPGSHKPDSCISKKEFLEYDKYLSTYFNAKVKIGLKDVLKEKAEWIKTSPGDCVIFDPRLIHTGGEFQATKYSIFSAYGVPNSHLNRHYTYYRHLRYDLEYKTFPEKLKLLLIENGLYLDEKKYFENIDGAWVPSKAFSYVSKLFT